jgi:hypothetical protein
MARYGVERAAFVTLRVWFSTDMLRAADTAVAKDVDALYPAHPCVAQLGVLRVHEARGRNVVMEREVAVRSGLMLDGHARVARLLWLEFLTVLPFRLHPETDFFYRRLAELLVRRLARFGSKLDELQHMETGHRNSVEFFEEMSRLALLGT